MTLGELLDYFSTSELAEALFQASLPAGGNKADRISRLHAGVLDKGMTSTAALDLFTADALRVVCGSLNLPSGRKADMIQALAAKLSDLAAPIVTPPPPVTYLDPTKEAVLACLREIKLLRRRIRSEADFEDAVCAASAAAANCEAIVTRDPAGFRGSPVTPIDAATVLAWLHP